MTLVYAFGAFDVDNSTISHVGFMTSDSGVMLRLGSRLRSATRLRDLPRPTTARGEATRQKLLDAAEAELGQSGFARASVASIVRRAGVAQGTFYLYFPSKEDLLYAIVHEHIAQQAADHLKFTTQSCCTCFHRKALLSVASILIILLCQL